mgnify:FL=1
MEEKQKQELWETFCRWWTLTLKESEPGPDICETVFIEGTMIADCDTYTDLVAYWARYEESVNQRGLILSEDSKQRRVFELAKGSCCKSVQIYVQEIYDEDDVRSYCEKCWDELEDDRWRNRTETSHDEARNDLKQFAKFFSFWRGGLIDISESNNTCWKDEEIQEIFAILSMYVDMDDEAAKGFDNHVAAYRLLAASIINYLD